MFVLSLTMIPNICKKIREARLRLFGEMVRTCGEKCRGSCSNENMEVNGH